MIHALRRRRTRPRPRALRLGTDAGDLTPARAARVIDLAHAAVGAAAAQRWGLPPFLAHGSGRVGSPQAPMA